MIEVRRTHAFADWIDTPRERRAAVRIEARIDRLRLGNAGDVKTVGEGGGDKSTQVRDIKIAKAMAAEE